MEHGTQLSKAQKTQYPTPSPSSPPPPIATTKSDHLLRLSQSVGKVRGRVEVACLPLKSISYIYMYTASSWDIDDLQIYITELVKWATPQFNGKVMYAIKGTRFFTKCTGITENNEPKERRPDTDHDI
ncbi:hypothetical protein BLOT_009650 [Blomia tropicalis]|nr:hypothetical protein BLOT_009650 [Blomia tropicalis]